MFDGKKLRWHVTSKVMWVQDVGCALAIFLSKVSTAMGAPSDKTMASSKFSGLEELPESDVVWLPWPT